MEKITHRFASVALFVLIATGVVFSMPLSVFASGQETSYDFVDVPYDTTTDYTFYTPTYDNSNSPSYTPDYSSPSVNNYYDNSSYYNNTSNSASAYASANNSTYYPTNSYNAYSGYTFRPNTYTNYSDTGCGYYYCGSSAINFNFNKNVNTNTNTTPAPTCSDIGQTGIYPNCHPYVTHTCAETGQIGIYPNCTTPVVHTCAEVGETGIYPNCHAVVTHTCAEYGQRGTYPNCRDISDPQPSCDISASDTSINEGDRVTLRFSADNADSASINQGIGSVDANSGTERVSPDQDTTYKMTVRGSGGTDTCSVTVRVDSNVNSSVVYTETPIQNPQPTVYLSSLPYTGLEDITPEMMMYWLLLIAGVGAAGYFFIVKGKMLSRLGFVKVSRGVMQSENDESVEVVETEPETSREEEFVNALANGEGETAIDFLRTANVNGSIESFLATAATKTTDFALASRITNALEASQVTGVRGAKEALLGA